MKLPTLPATFTGASATVVTATVGVTLVVAAAIAGAYLTSGAGSGSGDRVVASEIGGGDRYVGAPGPVTGASLPGIIVVGCGAYWLVRRRRR